MKNLTFLLLILPFLTQAKTINGEYAFVKNKGQFDGMTWNDEIIKYGLKQGNLHIFFTDKGLRYRFNKNIKTKASFIGGQKRDNVAELIFANWVGCNVDVEIIASEKTNYHHTYSLYDYATKKSKSINQLHGYKKIIYKNLYNNIDVEYYIYEKGGIKYDIILKPGANPSQIKLEYKSLHTKILNESIEFHLNNDNAIEITTSLGKVIEHTPQTYYKENQTPIKSSYLFKNNIISFNLENYDNTKEIIIDPWITSPSFSGSSAVWEVETDYYGNIYTVGGETPTELKKFNSSGSLIWTYSTPFDTVGGDWLGTLLTDAQGNSFISQGTAPIMERIDSSGNMVWHSVGNLITNPFEEYWSMTFNSDTSKLIVGGTSGTTSPSAETFATIYNFNLTNGSEISRFVFAKKSPPSLPPNTPEEIRAITIARNNQYIYLTHDSLGSIDQDFDTHPLTARTFQVNNQHNLAYKAENIFPSHQNGAPLKALAANDNYFYTHIGDSICQWDLSTGNLINTVYLTGGSSQIDFYGDLIIENAGIDIDSCNNVYVGTMNKIFKFDENLNLITQDSISFIAHDLSVSNNGEIIVVGAEFNNTQNNRNGKVKSISSLSACPQYFLRLGITAITSVNQHNDNIIVTPNPFNNSFRIDYPNFEENTTLTIYNSIGKLVHSEVIHSSTTTINLENKSNGIYFVKIINSDKRFIKKIIKQ